MFQMMPIGFVRGGRSSLRDDFWGTSRPRSSCGRRFPRKLDRPRRILACGSDFRLRPGRRGSADRMDPSSTRGFALADRWSFCPARPAAAESPRRNDRPRDRSPESGHRPHRTGRSLGYACPRHQAGDRAVPSARACRSADVGNGVDGGLLEAGARATRVRDAIELAKYRSSYQWQTRTSI